MSQIDASTAVPLAKRSAERRRRLQLADIEPQLGELATPEDAQRWLRQAFLWAAAEKVSGSRALAMVSAMREWLKAFDAVLDRERIGRLEARLRELEAELAGRPAVRRIP